MPTVNLLWMRIRGFGVFRATNQSCARIVNFQLISCLVDRTTSISPYLTQTLVNRTRMCARVPLPFFSTLYQLQNQVRTGGGGGNAVQLCVHCGTPDLMSIWQLAHVHFFEGQDWPRTVLQSPQKVLPSHGTVGCREPLGSAAAQVQVQSMTLVVAEMVQSL